MLHDKPFWNLRKLINIVHCMTKDIEQMGNKAIHTKVKYQGMEK